MSLNIFLQTALLVLTFLRYFVHSLWNMITNQLLNIMFEVVLNLADRNVIVCGSLISYTLNLIISSVANTLELGSTARAARIVNISHVPTSSAYLKRLVCATNNLILP